MSTNVTWLDGVTYSIPAGGEVNWPSLSNFLIALGNKAAITTVATQSIRVAVTSPVTILAASDSTVITNLTVPGAVAVTLPAGVSGRLETIVDGKGDAGTNNVTITPSGSDTINGQASLVLNHNRQSVTLQYHLATTDWKVISNSIPAGTITPADIVGVIPPDKGGTGISNNAAATTVRLGNYQKTENLTGITNVTYPTTGTLATLNGAETLASKSLTTPVINGFEDFVDVGADPSAPAAGRSRFYTKSGQLWKITSSIPAALVGAGGSGSGQKNYLAATTSNASAFASTGSATAVTTTTAAELPEPSVGSACKFTMGAFPNYSYVRWTVDPSDYATRCFFHAAQLNLAGFVQGCARVELYSNTASNYAGTSTKLPLSTDTGGSQVSLVMQAQQFQTFYDAPGSSAPYLELRVVTVASTGAFSWSSMITGPGSVVQVPAISNPISFTPSFAALGTVTGIYAQYEILATAIRVWGKGVVGTPQATNAVIFLPNNWTTVTPGLQTMVRGRWSKNSSTAAAPKGGTILVQSGMPFVNFSLDDTAASISPFNTNINGSQLFGTGDTFSFDFTVNVNELGLSGTTAIQADNQYFYPTAFTWGTTATLATGSGLGGILGGTTTPAGTFFTMTCQPPSPIAAGSKPELEISSDGVHFFDLGNFIPGSAVLIEKLRFDGTNYIGAGVAANGNNVQITFGKYASGTSTTYASVGTFYFRVKAANPGQPTGVQTVVPSVSSGLVPASGLPGRTDGNVPALGTVGEYYQDSSNANSTSQNANRLITSRTLQPGVWLVQVNASIVPAGGTTSGSALAKIILNGTNTAGLITGGTYTGVQGLDVAELDGTLAASTVYPLGSMTKILNITSVTVVQITILASTVVSSYNGYATATYLRIV